jgi:hypothetical protein
MLLPAWRFPFGGEKAQVIGTTWFILAYGIQFLCIS